VCVNLACYHAGDIDVALLCCDCRTAVQEREFEAICTHLLNAKKHVVNAKDWLMTLKSDKPKVVSLRILSTLCSTVLARTQIGRGHIREVEGELSGECLVV